MNLIYDEHLTDRIQTLYTNIYDVYEWYDGPTLFEFTDRYDCHWVAKWYDRVDATEFYAIIPGEGMNAFDGNEHIDYMACATGPKIVGYYVQSEAHAD